MNDTQRPTGPSPTQHPTPPPPQSQTPSPPQTPSQHNPLLLDEGPAPVIPTPQAPTGVPQGQFPQGQFPPNQFPQSQFPQGQFQQGGGPQDGTGRTFSSTLDQGLGQLKRAPLHRDSTKGVIGGVCAGIAERTGASVVAVRAAAAFLALFFGAGIGAYLLAWALLPDQSGATHAEQAVRDGRPRSLLVLGLGALALMGLLGWIFDSAVLPLLAAAGIVAYVVTRRKESSTS